jgi:hypothetical protein
LPSNIKIHRAKKFKGYLLFEGFIHVTHVTPFWTYFRYLAVSAFLSMSQSQAGLAAETWFVTDDPVLNGRTNAPFSRTANCLSADQNKVIPAGNSPVER